MFIFAHFFFPLLIFEIYLKLKTNKNKKIFVKRFWLLLGSILPDLIDKPISLSTNLYSGRGFAHTPFFIITLCLFLLIILGKKKLEIPISLFIGCVFHLILDIPSIPWFWPILPLDLYQSDLNEWYYTLFNNPFIYISELISLFGFLIIGYHYKLILRKKFINFDRIKIFMFKSPQSIKIRKNNLN